MSLSKRDMLLLFIGLAVVLTLVVWFAFPPVRGAASSNEPNANYSMFWQVVASGGTRMTSPSFTMQSTAGQAVIGNATSASYRLHSGFWYIPIYNVYLPTLTK